jgi:curli biogenesis system outer membrane secretion channel CsgG
MRLLIIMCLLTVCTLQGYAQSEDNAVSQERELQKDVQFINQKKLQDDRDVVGVSAFKCDIESPFAPLVTEKVVEVLKNSNRFIVVDRTNRDKVVEEMELQKREEFIGKDVAEQGNSLAAKKLIQGTITKIPVYRMKNSDGSVRGYKASVAFQLKVDDVDTQQTTEAMNFEGKASKECVSAQAAVQIAMNSLEPALSEYFRITFPLHAKIVKILSENKGKAESIMIMAGEKHGVKVGDEFEVSSIEMLEGEELPIKLGTVTVKKLIGQAFSECKVNKDAGQSLYEKFNANAKIRCTLIVKK